MGFLLTLLSLKLVHHKTKRVSISAVLFEVHESRLERRNSLELVSKFYRHTETRSGTCANLFFEELPRLGCDFDPKVKRLPPLTSQCTSDHCSP